VKVRTSGRLGAVASDSDNWVFIFVINVYV
jgi:hypothetical protein